MKTQLLNIFALSIFFCGLAATSNSFAATLTVTKTGDTSDGVCDSDCSLREAVYAANFNDVIVFSTLFDAPQTITLENGQILIIKNLTIVGPSADLLTVSANNAGRIFYIANSVNVSVSGMKISNGKIISSNEPYGGAIYVTDSSLTLTNMKFSENTSCIREETPCLSFGFGGAIYALKSTLTVNNSTFTANNSYGGSGVYSRASITNISNGQFNNNDGTAIEGGSIVRENAQVNVFNSTIINNNGGAVYCLGDRLLVKNSLITGNFAGVSNGDSYAEMTVDGSVISNNQYINIANAGGGVDNRGTATIINTIIRDNYSTGTAGGVFNVGRLNIINSAIVNNQALRSAGGIFNAGGTLYLTNSTVSGNRADFGGGTTGSHGGGIFNKNGGDPNFGGYITITNSTIADNHATGKGGGIYQESDNIGTITVRNTILARNTSSLPNEGDVSGRIISQGINLVGNATGSSGWLSADLLNRDPLLGPLANNGGGTLTHALLRGSLAIDAGDNNLVKDPITNLDFFRDQRGSLRIRVGATGSRKVDIGAYEADISDTLVTLGGRVLTSRNRGIGNVTVTLTASDGTVIYALTNPFGYYRFKNLVPSTTYTVTVRHKRYKFESPQFVTIENERLDFNFTAQ